MQTAHVVGPDQTADDQNRGQILRADGRKRDAGDIHVQPDHKAQVEHDVDDAGDDQEIQRTAGIADRAQDGGAEVIDHKSRHAAEIDRHVQDGFLNDVVRRPHEGEQRTRGNQSDNNHQKTAHKRDDNRGVDGLLHRLLVLCPVVAGGEDVGADGDADKQIDQQHGERGG